MTRYHVLGIGIGALIAAAFWLGGFAVAMGFAL